MHAVSVRKEIVDRVLQRRGRYHLFDRLDPPRTALVVIDMQSAFCAPGGPGRGADVQRHRRALLSDRAAFLGAP